MLVILIGIVAVLLFITIAFIHFYWAFGGRWGIDSALPKTVEGERMLNPGPVATIIVGLGLLLFGALFLIKLNILDLTIPEVVSNYGLWGIGGIFALRALGDFRYVGFFKKIKNTNFAKKDSLVFTPLCLFFSFAAILTQLN